MARQIVKEAWESWYKAIMPPDVPATQIIETRRAFYAGFVACMTSPINSVRDAQRCQEEIQTFFDEEVKTGFGVKKPGQEGAR